MSILPIVLYPDPVLKTACEPVAEVTGEIAKLLDDLAETMYAAPGVGLAAPQVGVKKRVLVCDVSWREEAEGKKAVRRLYQLINPKIVEKSGQIEWEEGCLSIPGFMLTMQRAAAIKVEAFDKKGRPIGVEAEGLLAVCLQHEIDHLDGKLIIDKVSRLKKNLYLEQLKKGEFQTPYPTSPSVL